MIGFEAFLQNKISTDFYRIFHSVSECNSHGYAFLYMVEGTACPHMRSFTWWRERRGPICVPLHGGGNGGPHMRPVTWWREWRAPICVPLHGGGNGGPPYAFSYMVEGTAGPHMRSVTRWILGYWSGFEAATTAPWPSRRLHHFGKFVEPSDELAGRG